MSNSTEKPASRSSARAPVSAKDKQATDKPASKGKAEEPAAKPKPSKRAVTTKDGQPTYLDMIKEAIVQSGETKEGLSRQGIKKHLYDIYGIPDDNAAASRISAAIKKGTGNGVLLLPKGASGRVKLGITEQENTPAPRAATARVKAMEKKIKKDAAAETKRRAAAARPKTKPAAKPMAKPSASSAKKVAPAASKKTTSSTTKRAAGKTAKAAPAAKPAASKKPAAKAAPKKSAPKSVGKGDVKKTARAPPRDRSKPTRPVRSARKST